jgi:hypothetical protein
MLGKVNLNFVTVHVHKQKKHNYVRNTSNVTVTHA